MCVCACVDVRPEDDGGIVWPPARCQVQCGRRTLQTVYTLLPRTERGGYHAVGKTEAQSRQVIVLASGSSRANCCQCGILKRQKRVLSELWRLEVEI